MGFKPSFMMSAEEHVNQARIDADAAWKTLQDIWPDIRKLDHPLERIEAMAKEHPERVSKDVAKQLALSTHHIRRLAELIKRQTDSMEKKLK